MKRELPFVLLVVLSILVVVLSMNQRVGFTHDSTNYMAAARTLLEQGKILVYINWPSYSMKPEMEPFTDYPPGYPVYLAVLLFVSGNVIVASFFAQVTAVVLLFAVVYILGRLLRLGAVTRVGVTVTFAFLSTFETVYRMLSSELLFIVLSLGVLACVVKLLEGEIDGNNKICWMLGLVLLVLSSSVKFIGVFNAAFFMVPVLRSSGLKQFFIRLILVVGCAGLPIVLWFLRNKLTYGLITRSHWGGPLDTVGNVTAPFRYFYKLLGNEPVLVLVSFGVIAAVSIFPALHWRLFTRSGLDRVRGKDNFFDCWFPGVYVTLSVGMSVHFFGLYTLSLLINFNSVGARLLSPTISICIFLVFIGLDSVLEKIRKQWSGRKVRPIAVVTMLLAGIFFIHPAFGKTLRFQNIPRMFSVRVPVEQEVWERLKSLINFKRISHFYSDFDIKHQLFTPVPQLIIWNAESFDNKERIMKLMNKGKNPFFLFKTGKLLNETMEKHYHGVGLEKIVIKDYEFVLYK